MFCRTSIGCPLDSTGRLVEFCWTSTRILHFCFKCLRIANFIKKCNKKLYWTSSRISIGRPLESTGRPVELLYRTSPRAEDLAQCPCMKAKWHACKDEILECSFNYLFMGSATIRITSLKIIRFWNYLYLSTYAVGGFKSFLVLYKIKKRYNFIWNRKKKMFWCKLI